MRYAFAPYIVLFGNFFWGIIFGFIGAGIYVSGEGPLIYLTILGYLVIVAVIFVILLPLFLVALFGLILTFIVTVILYNTFVVGK